mmetsp:Transcript_23016/g.58615  ORF Transcript_23016/g.58615 Transcript_23016/m.58615 type:complete len:304 (+) Transcript_23016:212-1123(+)
MRSRSAPNPELPRLPPDCLRCLSSSPEPQGATRDSLDVHSVPSCMLRRRPAEWDAWQGGSMSCEVDSVLHQHRDGHGPHAAGHRGDRASHLLRTLKLDVTAEYIATRILRRRLRVHPHIDHRRTRLQPVALHHLSGADGCDDHISTADVCGEVGGARMADGDGRIHGHQQVCHWHTHDVRPTDHHDLLATHLNAAALQELDATSRRAGHSERGLATAQAHVADVSGREAVDVLCHLDRLEHLGLVDVPGQWQLDEDRVNLWVGVELADSVNELLLRDSLVEAAIDGEEAALSGRLLLHSHVRR